MGESITLLGGLTVPETALEVALDVEAACWEAQGEAKGPVYQVAHGRLYVTPSKSLTADQRAAITRWKRHLIALVEYRV